MEQETGSVRKHTYDELVSLVYDDLRRQARGYLRRERADSVQATVLVHEAYQRLLPYRMAYQDRNHFLNVAATAMRRFLIERARRLSAARRGSRQPNTTLDDCLGVGSLAADPDLLLDIERALDQLTPDQVRLTELRFFAGFTIEEAAGVMGVKVETARKRWRVVKVLLGDQLTQWR
jgi:RNA polymerase sigma factor (TIGR02999 family)